MKYPQAAAFPVPDTPARKRRLGFQDRIKSKFKRLNEKTLIDKREKTTHMPADTHAGPRPGSARMTGRAREQTRVTPGCRA